MEKNIRDRLSLGKNNAIALSNKFKRCSSIL